MTSPQIGHEKQCFYGGLSTSTLSIIVHNGAILRIIAMGLYGILFAEIWVIVYWSRSRTSHWFFANSAGLQLLVIKATITVLAMFFLIAIIYSATCGQHLINQTVMILYFLHLRSRSTSGCKQRIFLPVPCYVAMKSSNFICNLIIGP